MLRLGMRQRLRIGGLVVGVALAGAAWAQTIRFDIAAQPAASGIAEFARQSGAQVLISGRHARGLSTRAVAGELTTAEGLARLLQDTGLVARPAGPNTWTIVPAHTAAKPPGTGGGNAHAGLAAPTDLPEILVQGHYWSLNTGIPRSEDDSQPYVVFEQEQLQRSGAHTLEDFFRSYLGANTAVSTSNENIDQAGLGRLNLRGLGFNETLVLLDGRRLAGSNTGSGYIGQANVAGVALESIERIEVLASSASSIYGANATGGVINIVRKRDYRGLQLTAQYGNVVHGNAPEREIGLNGGWELNEGRTLLSISAGWQRSTPLLLGQRPYHQRFRQFAQQNNPDYFAELASPPIGATPNIRSSNGQPLIIDDGTPLGSHFTHVPDGYRGSARDGIAGLLANAGTYNTEYGQTSVRGALEPLTNRTISKSVSVALRQALTPDTTAYAELALGDDQWRSSANTLPSAFVLPASAPNNPFRQAIQVAIPNIGADAASDTHLRTWRGLAGMIVRLPRDWQAVFDLTWSRSRYRHALLAPPHDLATTEGMEDGTIDVLRDLRQDPITYGYIGSLHTSVERFPADATNRTASMRLAGPLSLDVGGGPAMTTLLLERAEDSLDQSVVAANYPDYSQVDYTPARALTTESAYAELKLPLFGEANAGPWRKQLDLQIAARYDQYTGRGADAAIPCRRSKRGAPLDQASIERPCPEDGAPVPRARNVASSTNPTYSLRWKPADAVMLRASYATGFLPAPLNQLIKMPVPFNWVGVNDPLRGGEPIGRPIAPPFIMNRVTAGEGNFVGGNPDLKPERSTSHSAGLVVTPGFVPGLRISADWTRIDKRDAFYDPLALLQAKPTVPGAQALFDAVFVRDRPSRLTRAAPSDGFAVGPVVGVDASLMNLLHARTESWDYALDYTKDYVSGRLDLWFRGTYLKELAFEIVPGQPPLELQGVVDNYFADGMTSVGGVQKKGSLMAMWSTRRWQLGWRLRYIGRYYPRQDRAFIENLGSNAIKSQAYNDLFASYQLSPGTQLRLNVDNIFDRAPPYDSMGNGYSRFADPRQAYYSFSVSHSF